MQLASSSPQKAGDARIDELTDPLLAWYAIYRRDLPWRRDPTPYRVLVSEVMLQQTQVERVIPYFEVFVSRFPDFPALAAASRADVIRIWSGMGYNRRAVFLHALAAEVMGRYGGELPANRAALLTLPGIGPYTAGAILSIAFGQDEPAPDTNVRRVITRVTFADDPSPTQLAEAIARPIPPGRSADWNQALMDLGSSICSVRRPRCLICPLQSVCLSAGRTFALPTAPRTGRTQPFRESNRFYRGRLLGELRALSPGATASLKLLTDELAAHGVAEPRTGWDTVAIELARDGLAVRHEGGDGVALGLA